MLETQVAFVIFRPSGTYDLWMKNMVPVLMVLFAFRAGFSYTDEKKSTPFVTIGSGPIFCC